MSSESLKGVSTNTTSLPTTSLPTHLSVASVSFGKADLDAVADLFIVTSDIAHAVPNHISARAVVMVEERKG